MTESDIDKLFEEARKRIHKHINDYAEASLFILDHHHKKRIWSINTEIDFRSKMGFPFSEANQHEKEYYFKYYGPKLIV